MSLSKGNYTPVKVTKGVMTNVRTGITKQFSINPHTVRKKNGSHLSEDPIPGFSDPKLDYAAGKTRTFSFQLQLDGEMTLRNFQTQALNNVYPQRDLKSYSIAGEIEWYESMTFPVDPNLSGNNKGGLDMFAFTMGSHMQSILVFVEDADTTIIEFSPDLEPTKATIDLTLKRIAPTNVFSNQVWSGSGQAAVGPSQKIDLGY
jgi:hypothetical protein